MDIIYLSEKEKLLKKAGELLSSHFSNTDKTILFLSSGGSAISILDYVNPDSLGPHITISVLDERYTTSRIDTNFGQLTQSKFYGRALKKNCSFISTIIKNGETQSDLAERLETSFRKWKESNGKIIATVGMGIDGHTAGIMPYPEDEKFFRETFLENEKWVIGYNSGKKNQFPIRITATLGFMTKKIDESVFFITGREKSDSLNYALSSSGEINSIPARIILEMKNVHLFTDINNPTYSKNE